MSGQPPPGTVGIIGLGRIGRGVAGALQRAGIPAGGTDVAPEARELSRGMVRVLDTPADVADGADAVLVAVLDDEQVRDVLSGAAGVFSAERPPGVVVILSTVRIETILWAGAEARRRGIGLLDCAVSGGHYSLEQSMMTAMVGGERADHDRARPVLESFASPVVYMGGLGNGMRAKLAANLISYGQWLVSWEGARLAAAAGVDPDAFVEVVRAGARTNPGPLRFIAVGAGVPGAERKESRALAEATGVYAHKDLAYALELGETLGVELPVARLTDTMFERMAGLDEQGR